LRVTSCTNRSQWDAMVNADGGHPLQLWGWGELKSRYEWSARRLLVLDDDRRVGSAQVLLRRLPPPFRSLAYIPRGPQAGEELRAQVCAVLADHLKETEKPIALTIEPDWAQPFSPLAKGVSDEEVAADLAAPPTG